MDKITNSTIENLHNIAKETLGCGTKAVNYLYVDMDCFINFKLGSLLCNLSSKEQYEYLLEKLDDYNNRTDDEIMKYFPEIDITESTINEFLEDSINHGLLEKISPVTDYYKNFFVFADSVMGNNKIAEDALTPKLYIGCNDVKLSTLASKKLCSNMLKKIPNWEINITENNIHQYGEDILNDLDHMTIYDIDKLFKNDRLNSLMEQQKFLAYKSVHAFPFVVEQSKELSTFQLLENTEIVCNIFCDFKYVIKSVTI